jgi:hypothetical protein
MRNRSRRYFARIADERMGPRDGAILVTHQPRWLADWFHESAGAPNLRQLVRGHLRGRARVHLAGARSALSCFISPQGFPRVSRIPPSPHLLPDSTCSLSWRCAACKAGKF